ncbi:MAG: hypothetical protein E7361_01715 [Clostridiales bacterium]|nr:hypothetical protein [Clostridiales bacterium]
MSILCGSDYIVEKIDNIISENNNFSKNTINGILEAFNKSIKESINPFSNAFDSIYLKEDIDKFFDSNVLVEDKNLTIFFDTEKNKEIYTITEDKKGNAYYTMYRLNTDLRHEDVWHYDVVMTDSLHDFSDYWRWAYEARCKNYDISSMDVKELADYIDDQMYINLRFGDSVLFTSHPGYPFVSYEHWSPYAANKDLSASAHIINTLLKGDVSPENVEAKLGILPENQPNFDEMEL